MSPYCDPDYAAFVSVMRANPDDAVTPLVCADWLDEHGKAEHAQFVRDCVELGRVQAIQKSKKFDGDLPGHYELVQATFELLKDKETLINRYCHEWTGGTIRWFSNPTAYDWRNGFLRHWSIHPLVAGSDRHMCQNTLKRFGALFARQPVSAARVVFSTTPFGPHDHYLHCLAERFPGVTFRYEQYAATVASEVTA